MNNNQGKSIIDLKDLDIIGMTEEEYNNKLKDDWLRKVSYQVADDQSLSKYYNYEVEEESAQRKYPLWDHVVYFFDVFLGWALLFITIVGLFVVLALMVGVI